MKGAALSLGSVLAAGCLIALLAGWLRSRASSTVRMLGAAIAALTFGYCAFVAFALIADNGGVPQQPAGLAATAVFVSVAAFTLILQFRIKASAKPK